MSDPVTVRPRVVLAKPGLDGHDRGVKVVGMALRDAGAEVVYLGLQQSASQIVGAALAEDVDIIGLSVLSGVHIAVAEQLIEACREANLDDIAIVIGGTIPPADVDRLKTLGVRDVFPVGTPLPDVVARIFDIAQRGRSAS
ncbi:cobalamin-dependent protein [Streptosporangium sp. NBC_01755]|uniref:cobalamin B12-binding domain-containing protein n=1 Tax=unclassified Streptosporangium TaxID=2632669 RepID=UPI002DDC1CAA|nr:MULTISPECIES: cobalamin-dependent protein [unclassified Streptosporangium]WSA26607.1 cobalamin-dependent protein [Streptosporangium sp. NBC_01810]WSD01969.1 cobalamin-dependent protein [Streptosporangium sp. NBC_01755]